MILKLVVAGCKNAGLWGLIEDPACSDHFFVTNQTTMLIRFCGAQHLICNVTQDLHGTLYSVPELEATECSYSWMNSTGHVLANEKGKMDHLVSNSSIRTLLTHTCFVQLNYTRDCVSEGIQHTASCLTDCMTPEPLKIEESSRQYWGIFICFSLMALLLVLIVLFAGLSRGRENHFSVGNIRSQGSL